MEATIRITVTTIIISRSEKPSGRLALFGLGRCMRRPIDALFITTHPQYKLDSGAASAELPRQPAIGVYSYAPLHWVQHRISGQGTRQAHGLDKPVQPTRGVCRG